MNRNTIVVVLLLVLVVPMLTGCGPRFGEDKTTENNIAQQSTEDNADKISDSEVTDTVESDWSEESDNVEIGEMI